MKFPFFLLIALCLYPLAASAAQNPGKKRIDLRPPQEKTEDPGSATPMLYKNPSELPTANFPAEGKKNGLKVSQSCTDSLGMVHQQGDRSYEACLRSLDKYKPSPRAGEKNPNSLGFTIGQ